MQELDTDIQMDLGSENCVTKGKKLYTVGTLSYTKVGLAVLFSFLLWGEFCWILLETVVPRIFPLLLKDLDASNTTIGMMVSSIPSVLYLSMIPWISVKSDRHRGPRGRRIPYLLITAPFVTIFMILIGYSKGLGRYFYDGFLAEHVSFSQTTFLLVLLCSLIILFQLFNTTLNFIYKCLFADVVPSILMGRFMAMTRAASTAGSFLFSRYCFGLCENHMEELLLGIGIIHLVAFLMLCYGVREGRYPKPEPEAEKVEKVQMFDSVSKYLKECFATPYYLFISLMMMCLMICGCYGPFTIFFYRDTLGITLDDIGKFMGWIYVVQALASIPMGWVCDRFNPVKVFPVSVLIICVMYFCQFFFIHDKTTLYIFTLLWALPNTLYYISTIPMTAALFPKEKYAQFNSAIQVLSAIGLIGGNLIIGRVIDAWGNRMCILWPAIFHVPAALLGILVYRGWKKYGGPNNYVPPK